LRVSAASSKRRKATVLRNQAKIRKKISIDTAREEESGPALLAEGALISKGKSPVEGSPRSEADKTMGKKWEGLL